MKPVLLNVRRSVVGTGVPVGCIVIGLVTLFDNTAVWFLGRTRCVLAVVIVVVVLLFVLGDLLVLGYFSVLVGGLSSAVCGVGAFFPVEVAYSERSFLVAGGVVFFGMFVAVVIV